MTFEAGNVVDVSIQIFKIFGTVVVSQFTTRSNQTEPIILIKKKNNNNFWDWYTDLLELSRFNTSEFSYVNFYEKYRSHVSLLTLSLSVYLSFLSICLTSLCNCLSVCARAIIHKEASNVANEMKEYLLFLILFLIFLFLIAISYEIRKMRSEKKLYIFFFFI